MKPRRLLPSIALAIAAMTLVLLSSAFAWAQEVPSLPSLPLPTIVPSSAADDASPPEENIIDSLLDPTGVKPPVLGGTIDDLNLLQPTVPPVEEVITGGNGNGGTGGGTGGGTMGGGGNGPGAHYGAGTSGGAGSTGTLSSLLNDPSSPVSRLMRSSRDFDGGSEYIGGISGRAMRLVAPMAAPVGIAVAGVLGLVMMAKSNGRLDELNDEKEALGGWTVIRL